jgi:hypothetical protein
MNIFNKYKHNSHFIAALGTLAFYGLFIVLLFMKPFGDSSAIDPENAADQEVPIIFQKDLIQDNNTTPPPENTQNTSNVSTKETQQAKEMPDAGDVDKEPQSEEINTIPAKQDSVLVADIKKIMEDIKYTDPDDSIQKKLAKIKEPQQTQKEKNEIALSSFEDKKFYYDNYRAIQSFKKVYPYVQKTKDIIIKLNAQLSKIKSNKEKHILIKQTEKELYLQFEKDVRNMSTSQGKLLLKLIARETDQTAFGLIKTYKGVIPATFWYGVGLFFHENMKAQYDSLGEDAQLEKIVQKYKIGKI